MRVLAIQIKLSIEIGICQILRNWIVLLPQNNFPEILTPLSKCSESELKTKINLLFGDDMYHLVHVN